MSQAKLIEEPSNPLNNFDTCTGRERIYSYA
jgi:hypothetical protein